MPKPMKFSYLDRNVKDAPTATAKKDQTSAPDQVTFKIWTMGGEEYEVTANRDMLAGEMLEEFLQAIQHDEEPTTSACDGIEDDETNQS